MKLTAERYLNLVRGGTAALGRNRQKINDLNVFPIPDGDTGDNMYMTIEAGSHATGNTLSDMAEAVSRGMLLGARGNSGVILSRIFSGLARGLKGCPEAGIEAFSAAMRAGVEEAYHAVSHPVEGTILTVLREGVAAADGSKDLEEYFDLWIAGMDLSLQRTPDLLDVLKKAGVVDSGGAGLVIIAEGMRSALRGEVLPDADPVHASQTGPQTGVNLDAFTEDSILEFGYCTEFLLRLQRSKIPSLETFDESVIRDYLQGQGDSLVFFRDGSVVKVHIHTQDPGAVLTRCRAWGEFLTVKVENMTLQHHGNHMDERFSPSVRKALGVVTVAAGEGLSATFREMGADVVIPGGQTMNPPAFAFLKAFRETNADTVLVFPNNANILLTAQLAAEQWKDGHARVIPTRTLGEGYFALASLDASLPEEELVSALTEAASSVQTGLVSRAIRDAAPIARKGDYIGIVDKDILAASPVRADAATALTGALMEDGADILVLFPGADVPAEEAEALRSTLEKSCPLTEVILLPGGQPVYDYVIVKY